MKILQCSFQLPTAKAVDARSRWIDVIPVAFIQHTYNVKCKPWMNKLLGCLIGVPIKYHIITIWVPHNS